MHLDADDILERIRRDYPDAYEYSVLRLQIDALAKENAALRAQVAQYGPPADTTAQFDLPEGGRHG